jgi:hypothetical protein
MDTQHWIKYIYFKPISGYFNKEGNIVMCLSRISSYIMETNTSSYPHFIIYHGNSSSVRYYGLEKIICFSLHNYYYFTSKNKLIVHYITNCPKATCSKDQSTKQPECADCHSTVYLQLWTKKCMKQTNYIYYTFLSTIRFWSCSVQKSKQSTKEHIAEE